eukprot:NODE_1821_length_726_cov_189.302170_g1771_i0.p1 GENE.NODE_1821_length_726_cov_189.302170_g1771_i0~~NODE_1821_length_726_cov_189.302170_g1771_i0.p1  ORF type:complete len:194 (-),score=56.68 NODE_1821_length_726_cov_189.302170_g1771_i0:143-649(-)
MKYSLVFLLCLLVLPSTGFETQQGSARALFQSSCGDGNRTASEACDDGNVADGDGCNGACQIETGCTCSNALNTRSTCSCSRSDDDDGDDDNENWYWALGIAAGLLCLLALLGACAFAAYSMMNRTPDYYPVPLYYRSPGSPEPLTKGAVVPAAPPVPIREFDSSPLV